MRYLLSIILILSFSTLSAQTVGQLRYDTLKVTKANGVGNAELIIANATRDTLGIATNVGGGLIRYIRPKAVTGGIKIGLDTVLVSGTGSGNDSAYVDMGSSSDSTEVYFIRDNGVVDTLVIVSSGGSSFDTTAIYAAISDKLNISDTAAMLSPYLTGIDTLSLSDRIDAMSGGGGSDSTIYKADGVQTSDRTWDGNGKFLYLPNFNYIDGTASNYVSFAAALSTTMTLNSTGASFNFSNTNNSSIAINDNGFNASGYTTGFSKQGTVEARYDYARLRYAVSTGSKVSQFRVDSTKALIEGEDSVVVKGVGSTTMSGGKKVMMRDSVTGRLFDALPTAITFNPEHFGVSNDTVSLIGGRGSTDTASLSDRINLKLNIADTTSMLSRYLRKSDTASLSNRIDLKLNKSDTASLSNRINTKPTATGWVDISATSTITGFTSYDTKVIKYNIVGKTVFVQWNIISATNAGNGTITSFTLPFNVSTFGGTDQWGICYAKNSTTPNSASFKVASGTNLIELATSANDATFNSWTTATTRQTKGFAILSID